MNFGVKTNLALGEECSLDPKAEASCCLAKMLLHEATEEGDLAGTEGLRGFYIS